MLKSVHVGIGHKPSGIERCTKLRRLRRTEMHSLAYASCCSAGEQQQRVLGDLESQYVAGLRRKDGRTVGLGL